MSTERIATLNRGRGGAGYRQKRCFLKLRKDADRKRLFCSNVSTLLSMIVALVASSRPGEGKGYLSQALGNVKG